MGIISRFFEKLLFWGAPAPFSAHPCENWILSYTTTLSHEALNLNVIGKEVVEGNGYTSNSLLFEVKDLNYPKMSGDLFIGNMNSSSNWCLKFDVTNSKGVIPIELNRIFIDENNFLVEEKDESKLFIGKLQNKESVQALKEFLKIHGTET